jgi:hypothetical protein
MQMLPPCCRREPVKAVFAWLKQTPIADFLRLALFALCLLNLPSSVQAGQAERVQILWAGTYAAQIVGTVEQPATAMGKTNKLGSIRKLETTTTVRGKLGTSFGFEYALLGAPTGAQAAIEIVVVLPEPGLLNPVDGKRTRRERWRPSPSLPGVATIVGYQFEMDWEIVPGRWTFQIWQNDHKLGEQSFCVLTEGPRTPSEKDADKKDPCHSAATA